MAVSEREFCALPPSLFLKRKNGSSINRKLSQETSMTLANQITKITNPRIENALIELPDRKSTRLNSSHRCISYAVFCLKKKKTNECRWSGRRGPPADWQVPAGCRIIRKAARGGTGHKPETHARSLRRHSTGRTWGPPRE